MARLIDGLEKKSFCKFFFKGLSAPDKIENNGKKIVKIHAFSISRLACSLPFFVVFSDFAVFGGLGGFQPQTLFAGDPQISSEMTLAKKL